MSRIVPGAFRRILGSQLSAAWNTVAVHVWSIDSVRHSAVDIFAEPAPNLEAHRCGSAVQDTLMHCCTASQADACKKNSVFT